MNVQSTLAIGGLGDHGFDYLLTLKRFIVKKTAIFYDLFRPELPVLVFAVVIYQEH